jgi:hypothetical protein
MSHIVLLHARLQVTISLALAALLLWGLVCALRGSVGRGYIAALWVVELLGAAEAMLGLPLLLSSGRPLSMAMHMIYGALTVSMLPGTILFARGRAGRREALTYAFICLLLLVVAMRAYQTGGAG